MTTRDVSGDTQIQDRCPVHEAVVVRERDFGLRDAFVYYYACGCAVVSSEETMRLRRKGETMNEGDSPQPPIVLAHREGVHLVVRCPYCRQEHRHGAAGGYGHRGAHCRQPTSASRAGYDLRPAPLGAAGRRGAG